MEKVYGSPKRQDGLYKVGRNKYELIYGFGEDENGGWNWRCRFNYKPSLEEIKKTILDQINSVTDEKILTGFVWNDIQVWLSQENQMNFKAAYDLTLQLQGATLPIPFKLGEDENGNPVYFEFTDIETFTDFYLKAFNHMKNVLDEGWKEKDTVDWEPYNQVR